MSFAAASGLLLSVIAVPVVVLYILKIKRHRRIVPYLKLWADLVADKQFSTLFQRLQRLCSLLLQLLIAMCLVFAFASLTLSDSYLREESVVLVLDTSASMTGLEQEGADRTRFEAARESARQIVEGRSAEDEFAVIAAGAQPEVLQGFTRSTLRLREALDALALTKAAGDPGAAVQLAEDLLQDKKIPRILLITDAGGGATETLLAGHPDVRWVRIGATVPNIAIRRFQVRKNHAMGTDYLLLVVANEADRPAKCDVEIYLEGKLRKVVPLELLAREVRNESLELNLPEGGFAKAVVVHPAAAAAADAAAAGTAPAPGRDGLALDDVAWAAVPPARLYSVMLVVRNEAEEEPFRAALGALGSLVDRQTSQVATPEEWDGLPPDRQTAFDLVLFVNQAPAKLPESGRFLCINALPGGLPAKPLGIEKEPRLRELDAAHPMNRFLEQRGMAPAEARPLDLTGGDVFMSTGAGPVGVVFQEPERKVVYLGLDVLSDMFFLQVAFPILLRNTLGWMHEEASELLLPTYRPGEVVRPRFSLADAAVEVGWRHEWVAEAEASGQAKLAVSDGKFFFSDTDELGRYWVRTGRGDYRTTVNLFDARESDLSMPEVEAGEQDLGIERSGFLFGRDLWPLLLLVAAFLWLLEWGLFHRRITE